MSEDRRIDISFGELKELYSKNKLFIGIRNGDDLQYLLNEGFDTEKRLSLYPIDLKYNCMWFCKLGYSPEKYYHLDPYITIEELKYKKGESLNIVNKMLEILDEYEHK